MISTYLRFPRQANLLSQCPARDAEALSFRKQMGKQAILFGVAAASPLVATQNQLFPPTRPPPRPSVSRAFGEPGGIQVVNATVVVGSSHLVWRSRVVCVGGRIFPFRLRRAQCRYSTTTIAWPIASLNAAHWAIPRVSMGLSASERAWLHTQREGEERHGRATAELLPTDQTGQRCCRPLRHSGRSKRSHKRFDQLTRRAIGTGPYSAR